MGGARSGGGGAGVASRASRLQRRGVRRRPAALCAAARCRDRGARHIAPPRQSPAAPGRPVERTCVAPDRRRRRRRARVHRFGHAVYAGRACIHDDARPRGLAQPRRSHGRARRPRLAARHGARGGRHGESAALLRPGRATRHRGRAARVRRSSRVRRRRRCLRRGSRDPDDREGRGKMRTLRRCAILRARYPRGARRRARRPGVGATRWTPSCCRSSSAR